MTARTSCHSVIDWLLHPFHACGLESKKAFLVHVSTGR